MTKEQWLLIALLYCICALPINQMNVRGFWS